MKHILQTMLERSDLKTMSYSGRGMFGKECLAVDCESRLPVQGVLATVFEDHSEDWSEEERGAFAVALRVHRTDQLGRGTVLYFPGIPHSPADTDEETAGDGSEE